MWSILLAILWATLPEGTFSIVAYDPETGELGVAVASRVLAVGYIVPWAEPGVGAIATQALANVSYGPEGLRLLKEGLSPEEVIQQLTEADTGRESRQIGVVDAQGRSAAYTGSGCQPWAGHRTGPNYAVQGNILVGPEVVDTMAKTFEHTTGPLAKRLLAALIAGDQVGGDRRGRQSAALLVVRKNGGYDGVGDRLVDLRVDDHPQPVQELARLYDLWAYTFLADAYLRFGDQAKAQGDSARAHWEYARAIEILREAIQKQPEKPEVYNALAWAFATRRMNLEEALRLAQRAHELAPDDPNIMDTMAEVLYGLGRYAEAVEWETRALQISPNDAFFQKQLQKFKRALGGNE